MPLIPDFCCPEACMKGLLEARLHRASAAAEAARPPVFSIGFPCRDSPKDLLRSDWRTDSLQTYNLIVEGVDPDVAKAELGTGSSCPHLRRSQRNFPVGVSPQQAHGERSGSGPVRANRLSQLRSCSNARRLCHKRSTARTKRREEEDFRKAWVAQPRNLENERSEKNCRTSTTPHGMATIPGLTAVQNCTEPYLVHGNVSYHASGVGFKAPKTPQWAGYEQGTVSLLLVRARRAVCWRQVVRPWDWPSGEDWR